MSDNNTRLRARLTEAFMRQWSDKRAHAIRAKKQRHKQGDMTGVSVKTPKAPKI